MLRTRGLETGLITILINEIILPKCMLGTKKKERKSKKPTTEKASKTKALISLKANIIA